MKKIIYISALFHILFLVQCSTVSNTISYSGNKINFSKILVSSINLKNTNDFDPQIALELSRLLSNDSIEIEIYCPLKFDSTEYIQLIRKFRPDVILSYIPFKNMRNENGYLGIYYNVKFFKEYENGSSMTFWSGTTLIGLRSDRIEENISDAGNNFYKLINETRLDNNKNNR